MQQDMSCAEFTSVNLPFIMSCHIYVHCICYATAWCSYHLHLEFPWLNSFLYSFTLFWDFCFVLCFSKWQFPGLFLVAWGCIFMVIWNISACETLLTIEIATEMNYTSFLLHWTGFGIASKSMITISHVLSLTLFLYPRRKWAKYEIFYIFEAGGGWKNSF